MNKTKIVVILILLISLFNIRPIIEVSGVVHTIVGQYVIEKQISLYSDDAFLFVNNYFTNSTTAIPLSNNQYDIMIGLRFQDVGLNASTSTTYETIRTCKLSFYTTDDYPVQEGDTWLTIYGIKESGNVPTFSSYTDMVEREKYAEHNNVNFNELVGDGVWWNTTDIRDTTRNLVNETERDIGFILYASSGGASRMFRTYEHSSSLAVKLYITVYQWSIYDPTLEDEYVETYRDFDIFMTPSTSTSTNFYSLMRWDDDYNVYPFQEKTAYSNNTDRFYVFGTFNTVRGRNITYITKLRTDDVWADNYTIWSTISDEVGELYTDYHLWNDGPISYLDVTWIDTYPATHQLYYCRYVLHNNGTMSEIASPQTIHGSNKLEPIVTIMVDSEGYPYIAYNKELASPYTYSAYVAWSITNNGTFTHFQSGDDKSSPTCVENLVGYNPSNSFSYVCELSRGANRMMYLSFLAGGLSACDTGEAYNQNSGNWTDRGIIADDVPLTNRWALSSSSNMSLVHNASLILPDGTYKELYEKSGGGGWFTLNSTFDTLSVMVIGASSLGPYYTIGHNDDERIVYCRVGISYNWTENIMIRDYTGESDENIHRWDLTAQQYPPIKNNKTLVSYAWKQSDGRYWHNWFYVEEGKIDDTLDIYYVVDINGTQISPDFDTLEDAEDWIDNYLAHSGGGVGTGFGDLIIALMGLAGFIMIPLSFIIFIQNMQSGDVENAFYMLMVLFFMGIAFIANWLWG